VVGLPGERVRILDKTVYIDGEPLDEPYAVFMERGREPREPRARNLPEDRIPDGRYLTLSDNRDNALDGRFWGYVPVELIRGKAMYVYWSENLARIGTDFRDR
jgi:signal peptidase I